MAQQKRTAFFISDGTGITAGALGQLLAPFSEKTRGVVPMTFASRIGRYCCDFCQQTRGLLLRLVPTD